MKIKIYIGTSLDGFIARKNGDIDWLNQFANNEVFHAHEQFISGIDAIVIGRGTFEKVLEFPSWPYKQTVFILSNSIKELPEKFKDKAIILSMKPAELKDYLSSKGFSGVYVDGGKVIQGFLREDLIDDLTITRLPILIGSGIPLFDNLDKDILFEHLETKTYSNGLVMTHYERKRK